MPGESGGPERDGPVVHLACSRGGHFDLLLNRREAFDAFRIVWVTQQSPRADALRAAGGDVRDLGEYRRASVRVALHVLWRSLRFILGDRPRLVVTSGAGIVVPFCLLARLGGARIIFVETSARVRGASSSGRVLARIAHEVIAQWHEMRAVYPRATIARSSVVEQLSPHPSSAGEGTFVGVGTHSQPFDRLLALVDAALETGILPQPALAQTGVSVYRTRHARSQSFLAPEEMETAIRAARRVVCHAGTGTIAAALRAGRRPLVLPRLARHGEHYDDHQQQIVDKLASLDLAVPLGDEITPADVERADRPLQMPAELEALPTVADCLRAKVRALLHPADRE